MKQGEQRVLKSEEVSLEKIKENMTEKGYYLSTAADWSSAGSAQA